MPFKGSLILKEAIITVEKVVEDGDASPVEWDFRVTDGGAYDVTKTPALVDGLSHVLPVPSGTYTVTESSVAGYELV